MTESQSKPTEAHREKMTKTAETHLAKTYKNVGRPQARKIRHKNNNDISNTKQGAKIVTRRRSCLFTMTYRNDRMRVQ